MLYNTAKLIDCLWLICMAIAICGSVYALFAAYLTARMTSRPAAKTSDFPAVTILKPLYGAEPDLGPNLSSFCVQDYTGAVQMVCGIQNAVDPARQIVAQVSSSNPSVAIELVSNDRQYGSNRKISNLINMMERVAHPVLILSDSDMRAGPHYLSYVVGALQLPGVGAVTCLYRGLPGPGLWSRLAAMNIDQRFLPNVLVGLRLGLAKPCFGSTIALRAETLAQIGGFAAFKDQLADDYLIGDAVRALGLSVAIPPILVGHSCPESRFSEVWAHELRWARTIRLVDATGYAGSVITHPLPFALAAVALGGFSILGVGSVLAALVCRALIPLQLRRIEPDTQPSLWLLPFRELLSFAVFLASFRPAPVTWRGHTYDVGSDGTLTPN